MRRVVLSNGMHVDVSGGDEYMVHFEERIDGMLRARYFPDRHAGEKLIETEALAWELAEEFALKAGNRVCNIYVVDYDFVPVPGYKEKTIARY